MLLFLTAGARAASRSSTLVISGENGVVISGLTVSTTSGDCIDIVNSTNITIEASQIGPCGSNNSGQPSRAISISGGHNIAIYDNYIHVENLASVCGNSHVGILIVGSIGPIAVQGNVVAYSERNIIAYDSSNVTVVGNFLLNPRGAATCANPDNLGGDQFQAWADSPAQPNTNINVMNNYTISSNSKTYRYPGNQSDAIDFGVTNGILIEGNYLVGGQYKNGCGVSIDYAANNAQVIDNVVADTGNCGIGIAGGSNHMLDRNKILITNPVPLPAGDVGISIWNQYAPGCGPVTVSGNLSYELQPNGWLAGYWYGGGCGTVAQTGNIWNQQAYQILNPISTTNPPPLIPPQPYACAVSSPYTTQTGRPPCSPSS